MSMSDDEIEILEVKSTADPSVSGNNDICQLCSANLGSLSATEQDKHYEEHDSSKPSRLRSKRKSTSVNTVKPKTTPMKLGKTAKKEIENNFWHPALEASPPDNYSPGVLSVLREALKLSHRKGATKRAVLCYEKTPHIYRESFDTSWGCGYRNFLMACAALMSQSFQDIYFACLDSPLPPGVQNLQRWIESAWECGYDDIGARELDRKLVDAKKKIGTGELYVAFTSRKIPCVLVDFDLRGSQKGFDLLVDWVVKHFTPKPLGDVNTILCATSPVAVTDKMPIILQYEGHSVTIVGYEIGKNDKYNLLVFDPSSKVDRYVRKAALDMLAGTSKTVPFTSLDKSKRREKSGSPPKKRSRMNRDSDDEAVSISDSNDEKEDDARRAITPDFTLDPESVINAFRLKTSAKKKKEYQVLYFTMGALLSDQEQIERQVVFSECER